MEVLRWCLGINMGWLVCPFFPYLRLHSSVAKAETVDKALELNRSILFMEYPLSSVSQVRCRSSFSY